MKDLIIIGASGFGRELAQWVEDINKTSPIWNVLGFIDDNPKALEDIPCDFKVLGSISDWQPSENEYYALGVAFPKTKAAIVETLKSRGAKFATLVHPTALVSKYAIIGEGTVITPRSGVNANAKIGAFVSILESGCGHDSIVGDYSTLSGRVNVNGHVEIGKRVYIGCAVSIAPGKKVGDDAQIGIGSVVLSNVKSGVTVFGNPAKRIDL